MIVRGQSLKRYNTFGLEVAADYFAAVDSVAALRAVLAMPCARAGECLLLGGGSNVLFTRDFCGLVVHLNLKGRDVVRESGDAVFVRAAAGENWHDFVRWTLQQGFGGLENLSLIPGQVGAAPIQNIGAYGVALSDVFYQLEALDMSSGQIKTLGRADCHFGYRDSIFKRGLRGKYAVLSVTFQLSKANHRIDISYGSIRDELERQGVSKPDIEAVSQAVVALRRRKLPDPTQLGNSGSFFKNPVVSKARFEALKAAYPTMVSYPSGAHAVKLAAAWLIERAGWKGYRKGDAGVHGKQALVLVNHGKATGSDILELARDIQTAVLSEFGVRLDTEVNLH